MLESMVIANTSLNTTIPGMQGFKRDDVYDKVQQERMNQEEFMWLYKG
jgi:hypothetical protein